MKFETRSLSPQESRVIVALTEKGRRQITRSEILDLLGDSKKAADNVIESLRRKGWLQRAAWGEYLLIPPEHGPDALGDSKLLARASRITDRYYLGFGSAAAHYGLTTQQRNVVYVVTPQRCLRARRFDWDKSVGYLERIGAGALARRVGWLSDHVNAEIPPAARASSNSQSAAGRHGWARRRKKRFLTRSPTTRGGVFS